MFGLINAVVGIPIMISFAAIVFKEPVYEPYLPQLARLAILSAGVHQLIYNLRSSFPFAVGQPTEVGLIFLSAMATSVADLGLSHELPTAEVVGTALVTTVVATFIMGLLTVGVGYFRLASIVQYIPLPVVGAYLAYVGYYVLAAGMGLGAQVEIELLKDWVRLLHKDALIRLVPTCGSALAVLCTMRYARQPWVLPLLLATIPAIFHLVLMGGGWTLEEAIANDWCYPPQGNGEAQPFWELYRLFHLGDIKLKGLYLPAMWEQVPKIITLFFVQAFGATLDVAAIQADYPEPVDYNEELITVGLANLVAGAAGTGFTGSYIFSQSIFSMKSGVTSYLHGWVLCATQLAMFLLPYSVIQYVPKFFFGALLVVFGVEILTDWLGHSFYKVSLVEYLLLLATLAATMGTNLEVGIAIGIVLSVLYFAYCYAQVNVQAFAVAPSRSDFIRTVKERAVLEAFHDHMMFVSLSGYLFFGSAQLISDKVVQLAVDVVSKGKEIPGGDVEGQVQIHVAGVRGHSSTPPPGPEWLGKALQEAPFYVLLDFRRVHGLDATAAQTFRTLSSRLRGTGVELVLAHLTDPTMRRLLAAHGVVATHAGQDEPSSATCAAFDSLDDAAQYCEETFLEVVRYYGRVATLGAAEGESSAGAEDWLSDTLTPLPEEQLTVERFMRHQLRGVPWVPGGYPMDISQVAQVIERSGRMVFLHPGEVLFELFDEPQEVFLILKGEVGLQLRSLMHMPKADERTFRFGPGMLVGGNDFILSRPRHFRAFCLKPSCALVLNRKMVDLLAVEEAPTWSALEFILLRDACYAEIDNMEYMQICEQR